MTITTVGASLPADQRRPRGPGASLSSAQRTPASSSDVERTPASSTPRRRRRSSTSAVDAVTLDRVPRPSTTPPPQLLTVEQVCAAVQLNPATVRRYIARGTIRGVRLGRELRVDQRDLQRFLDSVVVEAQR